ncbi:MAG: hypothetical protein ACOC7U_10735 [Spirochaetota bacterium]
MKQLKYFNTITIFIGVLLLFAAAGTAPGDVAVHGEVSSNTRFYFHNGRIFSNRNTLSLELRHSTRDYALYAEPQLAIEGLGGEITSITDLQDLENIYQPTLSLSEAYLDLYHFLLPSLDVRVGKQIMVWGTADRINPTSNLCPSDFSSFFDFGQKLSTNSLLMRFYISNTMLSVVYIPGFSPSLLPTQSISTISYEELLLPGTTSVGEVTSHVDTPDNFAGEASQAAAKLSTYLLGFDVSASYYYGRYKLPVIYRINLTSDGTATNIETFSQFPRTHVAGFDFAGSLFNMGIWGEAAVFFPEKVTTETYTNGTLIDSTTVLDKPYPRYLIGTDYTFENGLYYNLQFVHGFSHEIGKDNLNDYLVFRMEKDFFQGKLKLSPVSLVLTTGDWNDVSSNYGIGYIPELQYYPSDNVELDLGCLVVHGRGDNLFASLKDTDSMYVKAKVSF